ncbi:glutathione-dependent formaldehyde dehydrogenase [Sporosarcina sp. NCCP-2716]|uniref:zinc-dependent alcohol dehydrogenase n=1 Tax=Sporosarcina sp. NCCP-2716 TaxID=2943679 RepID=UPI002041F039|nr:zinc-dependent alcohol dehydrogenase [Sporosarcina sp. NCCP-2716]GKV69703.1 glutathione-dependent formaldehyde dehydrogenase [Sporosarcina sp. NCCP-2716]
MRAVTFQGAKDIQVKKVQAPKIEKPDDIIVRITSTAICGSDLHIYLGALPTHKDYVIGHEPMGIVEEIGPGVVNVKKGDRVIIPFNLSCGECFFCRHEMESQCDNSNPNPHVDTGGFLGFTERYGDYPGGQAEYLRVPFGNFTPFVVPESCELPDESLLFLSDIMPTAYWSVEHAGVKQGDTVIILGCGPVGLLAQKFAWQKGAKRVIAIDHEPYRLEHAVRTNRVEAFNFAEIDEIGSHMKELTSGGADVVIDCVGMDGKKNIFETVGQKMKLQGGTTSAIEIGLESVRKFGTIQLTGVYGSLYNAFPLGKIWERNVTMKMGQAPVIHNMPLLFDQVTSGKIDPTDIITHVVPLDEAADAYQKFHDHEDGCIKVILKP